MKILKLPEIIFESNAIDSLNEIIKDLNAKKILIVTDSGIIKTGIYDKVISTITNKEIKIFLYKDVEPDPSIELVQNALNYVSAQQIDMIIGLGGGSALDTAKVTAALFSSENNIRNYFGTDLIKNTPIPLVAIPTTAGTGSEVTPIAILSDKQEQLKKGIVSSKLIPKYAILDPNLTLGMPSKTTAYTGMDALAHAIEAFTSVNANNYTDSLAKKAIELILENIEIAYNESDNISARKNMILASTMAGIAFANAGVTAVHAFAYPLGGVFHVPHGLANSIMLAPIIDFNLKGNTEKFSKLIECFNKKSKSPETITSRIRKLTHSLNIPKSLRELDIPYSSIPLLSESAMKVTRLLSNNPRKITLNDAYAIYESVY